VSWEIRQGDWIEVLRTMPDESVQCCITSPPYWGLRDYGVPGQLGLERTPEEYVSKMVEGFREVRRVLRAEGTLWLNLGDCYATGAGKVGECPGGGEQGERWAGYRGTRGESPKHADGAIGPMTQPNRMPIIGLKPKDLVGVPWRVAFALQNDGWYLRQDIIWNKPNPMPESVTDRCTKSHEYLFLLTKSAQYYCDMDAIKEPASAASLERYKYSFGGEKNIALAEANVDGVGRRTSVIGDREPSGRNKRSVWTVTTQGFSEVHFATFPPALIEPCILAGTSDRGCCAKCGAPWERVTDRIDNGFDGSKYGERAVGASGGVLSGGTAKSTLGSPNGTLTGQSITVGWQPGCRCDAGDPVPCTLLDPFNGAGTTGLVATRFGRNYIGIELNHDYVAMAERRITNDAPLFNTVESGQ